MTPYRVIAEWDEDARVWVASSEDVPGLATGADTFEDLIEKIEDSNSRTAGGKRAIARGYG